MNLRQHAQLEYLEQQRIELRRKEHAERLKRIMDEKYVKMGMDYDYLHEQVEEKKEKKKLEQEQEIEYQRRFLEEQRLLAKMNLEEKKERQAIIKETNEFRSAFQKSEDRREYDLNRPDAKKVSTPARISDSDPWLSVSSGQKFDGEDLCEEDRKRKQKEQLKRWHINQILEKKNRQAKEYFDQKEWEKRYIENDQLSNSIGLKETELRHQMKYDVASENKKLALEKSIKEEMDRQREIEMNEKELEALKNSPLLSESRTKSVGVEGRLITSEFKGFTENDKKRNLRDREQQIEFVKKRKEEEKMIDQMEEAERVRTAKLALKQEWMEEKERKERERKAVLDNVEQAKLQKELQKARTAVFKGSNTPTEDFWNYFGKSER